MSRIIVKNLPKKVSEKRLKDLFASKGCITDLQLKYTKSGVFRQFAFVGYKTTEEAQAAREYFDNTFFDASKIQVQMCENLGDAHKLKPWSKYAKEKTVLVQEEEPEISEESEHKIKKKKKKSKKVETEEPESVPQEKKKKKSKKVENEEPESFPQELENDKMFAEFLDVNKARSSKPVWCDAPVELENDDGDENDITDNEEDNSNDDEETESIAKQSNVSDMEYLRTKLQTGNEACDQNKSADKPDKKSPNKKPVNKTEMVIDDRFTVKVKNLTFRCKKSQIRKFFHPLKPESLRLPPRAKGFAYVKFKNEKEMKQALNKNKCILDGRKVDVIKYEKKQTDFPQNPHKFEEKEKSGEELSETGRIFARNLCYNTTEDELKEHFSPYGPISKIHLPMEHKSATKNVGYAFVTFMFPEHAVKAFSKLDGTSFQGRTLHLIPARPEPEKSESNIPFKKKKEMKMAALSQSPRNWNSLFLGTNTVVDVMSKKYSIEKSKFLEDVKNESTAVRLALGETQLVIETRKFLLKNGVRLDAFSQADGERSKTVILVKNLPAKSTSKELFELFSKYGIVSKVLLPPSCVTAIIEFQESTEAKIAYNKLLAFPFHNWPLLLEWAPMDVFKGVSDEQGNIEPEAEDISEEPDSETKVDDEEPEPDAVLYVKNLNFQTTEENLRWHFRKWGPLHSATISQKKDLRTGKFLSMGFGFVHFKKRALAAGALNDLQRSSLDGHVLELKFSNKATLPKVQTPRKKAVVQEQNTSKILVRNIPFEATRKEIRDLFIEFGTIKTVRLPLKPGENCHRGFGFVDFSTQSDAKRAFDAVCHSTHLLGRRLVLEWANPQEEEVSELRKRTARDYCAEGPKSKLKKTKFLQDVELATSKATGEDVE